MVAILWDQVGERVYETGVDHGVLYLPNQTGVYDTGFAWNGLVSVSENPTGAEATPQYADNIKYLNLVSAEEFGATIEAFTYPEEFAQCDGSAAPEPGVFLGQQGRRTFGLAYRTKVGNDLEGTDFGYKIHTIEGEERVVIGIVGVGDVTACLESIEALVEGRAADPRSLAQESAARRCAHPDSLAAPALSEAATVEVVRIGPGWRAVLRTSADHTVELLCVENTTQAPQEFAPTEHWPSARTDGHPITFVSGEITSGRTVDGVDFYTVPPAGYLWLCCTEVIDRS